MLEKILSYTQPNGECLEWTRCFNTDGYPRMGIKGNSNIKVHRLVFELTHGMDISGLVIRHRCDNPKCINPAHLVDGTNADNMRDRDERERHGKAKLSHQEVKEIRDLIKCGNFKMNKIASWYQIDPRTVSSIKYGHHWKHVN